MDTKTVPTIHGHILTLYTKRFNRSVYYIDSACTKLATYDSPAKVSLNFPITEISTYPHAIPVSVFYEWFNIKDNASSQQRRASSVRDHFLPGSVIIDGAVSAGKIADTTNISCINGIQLVSDQLYSKIYSICPQHTIFNKDTGEFMYHPNVIVFLYLRHINQFANLSSLTTYIPHDINFNVLKKLIK